MNNKLGDDDPELLFDLMCNRTYSWKRIPIYSKYATIWPFSARIVTDGLPSAAIVYTV